MSEPKVGVIGWADLTVPDATAVRDFYTSVLGVTSSEVPMDGYADYCLHPSADAAPVVGVCHARGSNADLPAAWLVYFTVADLDASLAACRAGGGAVIDGPRGGGGGRFAVIRDPAGAVAALFQPG